jgi:hypothetical protein
MTMDASMDLENIIDTTTMSPQDKAILMLIERVEHLEDEVNKYKKDVLVRDILASDDKCTVYIDTFMYLLDIPPCDRSPNDMVKEIACKYRNGVSNRVLQLSALTNKPIWELTPGDLCWRYSEAGNNIYAVLVAMTHEELDGLWRYMLIKNDYVVL